jgi:hypothetical protein
VSLCLSRVRAKSHSSRTTLALSSSRERRSRSSMLSSLKAGTFECRLAFAHHGCRGGRRSFYLANEASPSALERYFILAKLPSRFLMSAVVSLRCGRLRLDQSSFSILLGCFGRRSSSKGRTTPVENRRLVSVPPKEKLFGPRPVDLRCSNVGHA